MEKRDYSSLRLQMQEHYSTGRLREALLLAEEIECEFPDKLFRTARWRASLLSALGEKDEALKALAAALSRGNWWPSRSLLEEEALKPLQKTEGFAAICQECERQEMLAQTRAKPELFLIPPNGPHDSVLFAIHWWGSDALSFGEHYRDALRDSNFLLALPQSSQVCGPNKFCWDDRELAIKELKEAYVRATISFLPEDTILSGASQGGSLSMLLALRGEIPAQGFISVVPYLPEIETYISLLKDGAKKMRGVIMTGSLDLSYSKTLELRRAMEEAGISLRLFVQEELGHDFPGDFATKLKESLTFILSGR